MRVRIPSSMLPLLLLSLALPMPVADSTERVLAPTGWTNVTPVISPPAMAGAVMAYSSQDNRFVLFGGWNGTTLGETWTLDPASLSWERLATQGSPPARGDGAFAYDSREDVFVLFGGWYDSPPEVYHRLGDTWIFYLSNATWVQTSPPISPSPRSDSAIGYDFQDGGLVLFGGFDGASYLGETWRYETRAARWTNSSPVFEPSPRADGRMAYDPRNNRFVLFGGNDFSGPNFAFHHLDDTWVYSWPENNWTIRPVDEHPSARDYAVFAYDDATGEFLLHGGFGERVILGDIWAFRTASDTWNEISVTDGPAPRFAAVGGYDSEDRIFIVFGGLGEKGLLADTWFFRNVSGGAVVEGTPPYGVIVWAVAATGIAGITAGILVVRRKGGRGQAVSEVNEPIAERTGNGPAGHEPLISEEAIQHDEGEGNQRRSR